MMVVYKNPSLKDLDFIYDYAKSKNVNIIDINTFKNPSILETWNHVCYNVDIICNCSDGFITNDCIIAESIEEFFKIILKESDTLLKDLDETL